MTTHTRVYDTHDQAMAAVARLHNAGIVDEAVGLLLPRREAAVKTDTSAGTTAVGSGLGAVIGGGAGMLAGAGLLTGVGMMAIPGAGSFVAAGWLASTLAGLVAGATEIIDAANDVTLTIWGAPRLRA